MLSLSKNEFRVIGFLIRNFSRKLTIRNIGAELKISAAGAHAALKKLEGSGIVKAEKLGTGLFYGVNLSNKAAEHLAAVSLLSYSPLKEINSEDIEKESRAALFDGKRLLVVTNNEENVREICSKSLKEIKVIFEREDNLIESLREGKEDVLDTLKKGNVLFGEELILGLIKKVMR